MGSPWAAILHAAEDVRAKLDTRLPGQHVLCRDPESSAQTSIERLDLYLPFETDLFPEDLKDLHPRLLAAISKAAAKLRESCQVKYSETCKRLMTLDESSGLKPLREYQEAFRIGLLQMYQREIRSWVDKVVKADTLLRNSAKRVRSAERAVQKGNQKAAFKNEYLPILEACFLKNQYPGHSDKELLARKTGMSYKQIHVWFQNRRSRMKKNVTLIPTSGECSSRSSVAHPEVPFSALAPSYAFPTIYPPYLTEDSDPFPCRFGNFSYFDPPCWRRRASSRARQHCDLDISSLCQKFAILCLEDKKTYKRNSIQSRGGLRGCSRSSSKRLCCDVTAPYTVRPPRAPLSSLVRNVAPHSVHHSEMLLGNSGELRGRTGSSILIGDATQYAQPKTGRQRCRGSNSTDLSSAQPGKSRPSSRKQQSKAKKTSKASDPSWVATLAESGPSEEGDALQQVDEQSPSQPGSLSSHPSPVQSVDSLMSMSTSAGCSSPSTYAPSPTATCATLYDNPQLPASDPYPHSRVPLMLPQSLVDEYPSPMLPSDYPFDFSEFSKGRSDYMFSMNLSCCPSYSDSLDAISRGLQSSSDIAPPSLTFDLSSLAF